jgi:hypothetical protein
MSSRKTQPRPRQHALSLRWKPQWLRHEWRQILQSVLFGFQLGLTILSPFRKRRDGHALHAGTGEYVILHSVVEVGDDRIPVEVLPDHDPARVVGALNPLAGLEVEDGRGDIPGSGPRRVLQVQASTNSATLAAVARRGGAVRAGFEPSGVSSGDMDCYYSVEPRMNAIRRGTILTVTASSRPFAFIRVHLRSRF